MSRDSTGENKLNSTAASAQLTTSATGKAKRRWLTKVVPLVVLLTATCLVWCTLYARWNGRAWRSPIAYTGDALWGSAYVKAMAAGEIAPLLPKNPKSLGAPFVANWNDYPSVEEPVSAWWALLTRLFGLFPGQNLVLLSAFLLSAVAFYYVCRRLRYDRYLSAAGAFAFAFSRYALGRGVPHLGLTYYWHIPLGLLVVWWCLARSPLYYRSEKFAIASLIAVAYGMQNPYYTWMFVQFLGWAFVTNLIQQRPAQRVILPLVLCLFAGVTFIVMNLDTFYSNHLLGPNTAVVDRNYAALDVYALKPVELLLPPKHRIADLRHWVEETYLHRTYVSGEWGATYLGLTALAGAVILAWQTLRAIAFPGRFRIPSHFWLIVWILFYSVVGGLNSWIGLSGLLLFRCTNRYSVIIFALLLLFVVKVGTSVIRRSRGGMLFRVTVATLVASIAFFDQTTQAVDKKEQASIRSIAQGDRTLVTEMETSLPPDAMVFQLPVMYFPEVPAEYHLGDYEEFRPYLYSSHLRFSYGSEKGRARDEWQHDLTHRSVGGMVRELQNYGFSALLVARRGYPDAGQTLLAELATAGVDSITAESADFICLKLNPAPKPLLPVTFQVGWSDLEGTAGQTWRWSSGNATIGFHNTGPSPQQVHVSFSIQSLQSRQLTLVFDSNRINSVSVQPGTEVPIAFDLVLGPGDHYLLFYTDVPGKLPGNGDARILAYEVRNFSVNP